MLKPHIIAFVCVAWHLGFPFLPSIGIFSCDPPPSLYFSLLPSLFVPWALISLGHRVKEREILRESELGCVAVFSVSVCDGGVLCYAGGSGLFRGLGRQSFRAQHHEDGPVPVHLHRWRPPPAGASGPSALPVGRALPQSKTNKYVNLADVAETLCILCFRRLDEQGGNRANIKSTWIMCLNIDSSNSLSWLINLSAWEV